MTIVVAVLFVSSLWVFLAAVLGGCGARNRDAAGDASNLLTGEVWLWERGTRGLRRRGEIAGEAIRGAAARSAGAALRSPSA